MSEAVPVDELRLDFEQPVRVVFRPGALADLGHEVRALGAGRAYLVTDPGVSRAGHAARARASLEAAGVVVGVYDRVREDPTTLDVERCRDAARDFGPELFVAVGGGSSIDTAKGANFLLTNGGAMEDYRGPTLVASILSQGGDPRNGYARKVLKGDPRNANVPLVVN
jgi:alcohol dehydrogenase